MATPTPFEEANFTWKGWPADGERDEVSDLPAYRNQDLTISCWRMSWRERLRILFTGRSWLHVYGPQPPIYVGSDYPFERPGYVGGILSLAGDTVRRALVFLNSALRLRSRA